MNSIDIFTVSYRLNIVLGTFLFLNLCGWYLYRNCPKAVISGGVRFLLLGFGVDFLSTGLGYYIMMLPQDSSFNIYMTISLFLKLGVLLLIGGAAMQIIAGPKSYKIYMGVVSAIGSIIIIYFCLISPNGWIVNLLHGLLPAIGFAYLTMAFFTRCLLKNKSGAVTCCTASLFITAIIFSNMSNEQAFFFVVSDNGSHILDIWSGAISYLLMGIGLLLVQLNVRSDELDKATQKIQKYDQRIKEIIKLSPFPIVISRLSDDTILLANDNFLKVFGITDSEISTHKFRDFFVDADNRKLLNTHLEKERLVEDFEILVKAKDGEAPFWLSTSANIIDFGYDIAIYAAFQDITDRKKMEDQLRTQATRDPLTSLYNRRYFEAEVGKRAEQNTDKPFSVFMIDADHFKRVNDTYGHKSGDKVLIALSQAAEKALRDVDIVARYGGEEFVVYLEGTDEDDALVTAERLRETISKVEVLSDNGELIKFTVSIGIASSKYSRDINELVKMSDDALYQAKESGRNRCCIYKPEETPEQPLKDEDSLKNIHPAFAADNNVEVSILGGETPSNEAPQS